jgi:hypothetical protein
MLQCVRWDHRAWDDFLDNLALVDLVGAWWDVRARIRDDLIDLCSDAGRLRSHVSTPRWNDMDLEILRDFLRTDQFTKHGASINACLLVVEEQIAKRQSPEE